ncbi:hypothetical protein B0H67DRAFT_149345 [Lasiosphaeris hirsuta]|uniref:Uncharacterized protein n=1 Tax=Lasiosphaeris hirsuta TaxID=260670 RepID=A0AA40ANV5_9PEZI|nr:hypothetical protein B0H67DRAFT_149345 [Lasiosphaeris hirsuta]
MLSCRPRSVSGQRCPCLPWPSPQPFPTGDCVGSRLPDLPCPHVASIRRSPRDSLVFPQSKRQLRLLRATPRLLVCVCGNATTRREEGWERDESARLLSASVTSQQGLARVSCHACVAPTTHFSASIVSCSSPTIQCPRLLAPRARCLRARLLASPSVSCTFYVWGNVNVTRSFCHVSYLPNSDGNLYATVTTAVTAAHVGIGRHEMKLNLKQRDANISNKCSAPSMSTAVWLLARDFELQLNYSIPHASE